MRLHNVVIPLRATVLLLAALLALGGVLSPHPAAAQPFANAYAKIMIHLVPVGSVSGRQCASNLARPKCTGMKVAGTLNEPYYAYLLVTDGSATEGIAGMQCGIDYDGGSRRGVDVVEWKLCAQLDFPYAGWPAPGSSYMVTWNSDISDPILGCQRSEPGGAGTGVVAVAGYFYLSAYTADLLKVTVRPVDGFAKVANCAAEEDIVEGPGVYFPKSHLGYAAFSDGAETAGYNPCGQAKPIENTTWGGVKAGDGR